MAVAFQPLLSAARATDCCGDLFYLVKLLPIFLFLNSVKVFFCD